MTVVERVVQHQRTAAQRAEQARQMEREPERGHPRDCTICVIDDQIRSAKYSAKARRDYAELVGQVAP